MDDDYSGDFQQNMRGQLTMSFENQQQIADGYAPAISLAQIQEMTGQYCAVEYKTRALLGHGPTWPEALKDVRDKGNFDRSFYQYRVPATIKTKGEVYSSVATDTTSGKA